MNFTGKLIEKVKVKQGILSDYGVAKIAKVSPQMLSNWKNEKSEANAEYTLRLLEAADISVKEALAIMKKQSGKATLSLTLMTATSSIALLALINNTAHCILC